MTIDSLGDAALDYLPCRYGSSRLLFRGPRSDLTFPYIAFLGGTETYGKFVETPFVMQLDEMLKPTCVNFGCMNAGVDVFLHDPFLPDAARRAEVTVLQAPSAQNMSNRLYQVHPRRNDRFVSATNMLRSIFPDVDFARFHFNKHMLAHLHDVSPERYRIVEQELHEAWKARMVSLLDRISGRIVLMWLSERRPDDTAHVRQEPMHVTAEMLEHVRSHVTQYVEIVLPPDVRAAGVDGMVFNEMEAPAAAEIMGPLGHDLVAERLAPVLHEML
jgi:hypothetical protein